MVDLLLINSPIFRTNRDPDSGNSVPPIGLGYIYSQLTLAGFACQFIDAVLECLLPDEVIDLINQSSAQFVGLNVFSSNFDIVHSIIENVSPKKTFLLGGPAIYYLLDEIKSWNINNDIMVITGEAELVIPEIIKNPLKWGKSDEKIKVINITPDSPFYPNDIDLPLDRTIYKNEPIYRADLGLTESHMIASRGCLYNCAFCTAATTLNQHIKPRYRSYASLRDEIESIKLLQKNANCIRILDDLFLRNQSSIDLAVKLFSGTGLFWRSMAHVNTFRDLPSKWLDDIKNSGCQELFVGVESGCDQTLRHIRKPFSADTAYKTITRVLDAKIAVKCYFILGFPGETESALQDTLTIASGLKNYAIKNGGKLRISAFRFRPYHGTALYKELIENGQKITQITNRLDIMQSNSFNPYDCVSGVYAEYNESVLNKYMTEMEKLNARV
jgi:radical SAM superfamily enzyme YgiQ (UPF0313 family)